MNSYFTEKYCKLILPPTHRTSLSKFRGVAHIGIETGRYESLAENYRLYPYVESELHVLFYCKLYEQLRKPLIDKALTINTLIDNLFNIDNLSYILSHSDLSRISGITCNQIWKN